MYVRFLEETATCKNHFEFVWPLYKIENEPKTEKEIENLPPWICSFNYGSVVAVKCQAVQK